MRLVKSIAQPYFSAENGAGMSQINRDLSDSPQKVPGGSLLYDEHDRINARGMPMLSADIFLMRQFYILFIYDRVMIMTSLS